MGRWGDVGEGILHSETQIIKKIQNFEIEFVGLDGVDRLIRGCAGGAEVIGVIESGRGTDLILNRAAGAQEVEHLSTYRGWWLDPHCSSHQRDASWGERLFFSRGNRGPRAEKLEGVMRREDALHLPTAALTQTKK